MTDGAHLRAARKTRGMTQIAMAQALGLAMGHLQQLEQDLLPVTAAVRTKFQRAFGIAFDAPARDGEPASSDRTGGDSP